MGIRNGSFVFLGPPYHGGKRQRLESPLVSGPKVIIPGGYLVVPCTLYLLQKWNLDP